MKMCNKTLYGIKFMMYLAVNYNDNYIKLNKVSEEENMSEKFLESIVSSIKLTGLINVKRGASGGYKLVVSPSKITLKQIVEALNDPILHLNNLEKESPSNKVINNVWNEATKKLDTLFAAINLENLIDKRKKISNEPMFYI